MQSRATSCTNGTRWPCCQLNYVVVSMQPTNADVFCSQSTRTSHIPASPSGFGRAPHPPSGLIWTNCGLSLSADSGHMALQLCLLLAELAFLLSELLQLLAHLPELLHQGSTFNLVALQLVNQLSILAAGHHRISLG